MPGNWNEQGTVLQEGHTPPPFHPSFSPSLLPSPTDSQWGKLWGPSSSNLDAPSLIYPCSHSSKGDMVGPNTPADHTAWEGRQLPTVFAEDFSGEALASQRINENSLHRSATLNCQAKDFPPTSLPAEESFQLFKSLSQQPSRHPSGVGLWRLKDLRKAVVTVHPQVTGMKIRKPRRGWP